MRPFLDLGLAILRVLPSALFEPTYAIAFWLVVLLVFFQYRRVAGMEERLYGFVKNQPGHQTILAAAQGLVGGLIGSFILVFVGVSLSGAGIQYLLPVALLLYLLSPRLMCFSYAGGIVAVLYLLFGLPRVSVGGIMALVGILHLTESLLIWLSGHTCATPVVIRNQRRELVGAFSLQKFWPVPIVVLVLLAAGLWYACSRPAFRRFLTRQAVALWLAAAAGLLFALRTVPDRVVELEDPQVEHRGGALEPHLGAWSRFLYPNGWRLFSGDSLAVPLHLPKARALVVSGWLEGPGSGELCYTLGSGPASCLPISPGAIAVPLPAPDPGRHRLTLQARLPEGASLVLDKLEVQR